MINKDFFAALEDLEREKGIDKGIFISALENALSFACKKNFGEAMNVELKLNPEKSSIEVCAYKIVVEQVEDPEKEISIEDAREIKKSFKPGDRFVTKISTKEFGRIAAQTAKQVVMQTLREAERSMTYTQYVEKENDLIVGVVSRIKEDGTIFVEIGKNQMEGMLLPADQVPNERFGVGDRIKVLIKKVKDGGRGPQVLLSRSSFAFIRKLVENEIPEIRAGIVEVKAIVREAGFRTKIAVYSNEPDVDAVGACVGNKGIRINAIVSEIGGEKIDVIPWSDDILDFIARSLSPAQVLMVQANEDTKEAKVIVPDDKLSLAIGKEGQNARLAARLTGWKIDVKSYSTAKQSGLLDMESTDDFDQDAVETDPESTLMFSEEAEPDVEQSEAENV